MSYFKDINIDYPITQFGNVYTAERYNQLEIKSNYGISNLRDVVHEDGTELDDARSSTLVTHTGAEYNLNISSASKSATLESAARGRYQPGASAEAGIGVRLASATLTGEQTAKWGYYDDNNGFYFKLDSNGLSVNVLRDGTETSIARADWNADKLDGTGDSGVTLDLTSGNIFQVTYAWYGYGAVYFEVITKDSNGFQKPVVVHRYIPSNATSVNEPNLPIRATVANGATAESNSLFVAGRQFSVIGKYEPAFRVTSDKALNVSLSTTPIPIMSFRRKSAFDSVRVLPSGYDILTQTNGVILELIVNGTLTGASYGTPSNTAAAETALEVDTSATAISGGEKVYESIHPAGQGASKAFTEKEIDGVVIPALQPVTLTARSVTGSATIDTVMKLVEEW